jgi:feruloyl esterase
MAHLSWLAIVVLSAIISPAEASGKSSKRKTPGPDVVIAQGDCVAEKLGTHIPARKIGEPVSAVTLNAPVWVAAAGQNPAYCRVDGSMTPIDPTAPNINFSVALPSVWTHRAVQVGGGGNNGSIPGLTGGAPGGGPSFLARGWAVSGSDSGHQGSGLAWSLNDESMKNLGYMQMKKTHDAAWVLIHRMYGSKPVYSYWVGNSQGGREGLTVAQKYPADYDGVLISVPIVSYSSLTLSRALHRIQEIPLENWVTNAKRTAIATEVVRQCDGLDGAMDGIVNNYNACRATFDVSQGNPDPWLQKRCPGVDPDPGNTSASACLTDGQISTMEFVQRRYEFATPLAFGNRTFGMWVPNTDPGGSGMIVNIRYRGQEGATESSPLYSWLGGPIVLGFLFKDLNANALDYVEGGELNARRVEISEYLDATQPNLNGFRATGGKLMSFVGTYDSLASSGAQLDYYQSVLDRMKPHRVRQFARFYVIPSTGHGLTGNNYQVNGLGETIPVRAIPNGGIPRLDLLVDWVENGVVPPDDLVLSAGGRSMPLCEYPLYAHYEGGDLDSATSYHCKYARPPAAPKHGEGHHDHDRDGHHGRR